MRIRSIKPEFWRSEDIGALNWDHRLLYIGLWSYVDDNGVGRDIDRLIVADLFALDDPRDTLATVSRGLQTLFCRGQITRYEVADKPYLFINSWERHQRIDKPNKPRYPLPTCEDAVIREGLATVSRGSRETPSPGAVEQRSRGTEEQGIKSAPVSRRKPEVPMPAAWAPNERHHEHAKPGVDVSAEAEAFRFHAQANDRRFRDWDAGFNTWLVKARPVQQYPGRRPSGAGPQMSTGEQRALVALELAQRFKAEENNNQQHRQIGAA